MTHWKYDTVERIKREESMAPIIEKIKTLLDIVETVDGEKVHTRYSAFGFVNSIYKQAKNRLSLTEKQMQALNKTFKKYNEKLEKKLEKNKKKGNK